MAVVGDSEASHPLRSQQCNTFVSVELLQNDLDREVVHLAHHRVFPLASLAGIDCNGGDPARFLLRAGVAAPWLVSMAIGMVDHQGQRSFAGPTAQPTAADRVRNHRTWPQAWLNAATTDVGSERNSGDPLAGRDHVTIGSCCEPGFEGVEDHWTVLDDWHTGTDGADHATLQRRGVGPHPAADRQNDVHTKIQRTRARVGDALAGEAAAAPLVTVVNAVSSSPESSGGRFADVGTALDQKDVERFGHAFMVTPAGASRRSPSSGFSKVFGPNGFAAITPSPSNHLD